MRKPNIVRYNGQLGETLNDGDILRFLPVEKTSYSLSLLDAVTESDITEASEADKIAFIKTRFVWGRIVKVHTVGEYQIIEYVDRHSNKNRFSGYINYDDLCRSYESLDAALAGVIAIKYEGLNGKADRYFMTVLKNSNNSDF
jgi:hypothetical protein